MKYQPITCVWEVTMGCNMRCGHCGSSCAEALPDQLSTEKVLDICDQIADMGIRWVTLSGGEPLTRRDLPEMIKRLSDGGVAVNIITNGWLLEPEMVVRLKEAGVSTVAISIDGTEEIHDKIRTKDAFAHAKAAFERLRQAGIRTGAVTTITKQNIGILTDLKEDLIGMGVDSWQVQLGLPMGNLKEKVDWVIEPGQVNDILDFCYETAAEGRIKILPADCIGYYTKKEQAVKRIAYESDRVSSWDGCNAGIRGFGILQNGDILGCTSIRSSEYIEGNLLKRSLREIWEDEKSFLWRRELSKDMLSGNCRSCRYGNKCLGGCPNTKLTINGDIYSDNQYCAYHGKLQTLQVKYDSIAQVPELMEVAKALMKAEEFQEACHVLRRVLTLETDHVEALKALGYCEYMCENFEESRKVNERAAAIAPNDPYALRGFAVALFRLGGLEEGHRVMRRAVELSGGRDRDLIDDLAYMQYHKGT